MTKPPPNETTARRLFSQRMRAAGWELSALGVLALMVGIGWNSRPFKKETK